MISLDTNILLPAVESRNAHHPRAAAFLESLQDRQDVALCKFIRKRPKIAPIDGFWAEPAFQALSRAARYCSAMRAGVRAAACAASAS